MAKAANIPGIDCERSAADGIRLVLTSRLEEMCALREGALNWSDPEGVHDMRVASRRLRAALRDFTPQLRKHRLEALLERIKNLADVLGQVRDEDVAIIGLEKVTKKALPEISTGIEKFIDVHREKQKQARKQLMKALKPANLSRLQSDFEAALQTNVRAPRRVRKQGGAAPSHPTYRELARSTILKRLDELEKLSGSLYHPLKIKPLHRMRIAAKHLRYALELVEHCWGKSISEFSREVAQLQSSLGELHDCDIWIDSFGGMLSVSDQHPDRKKSRAQDPDGPAEVWLLTYFVKLRTKHFRNSLDRWCKWQTNDLSAELRRRIHEIAKDTLKEP